MARDGILPNKSKGRAGAGAPVLNIGFGLFVYSKIYIPCMNLSFYGERPALSVNWDARIRKGR